jgi:hypothetical protein
MKLKPNTKLDRDQVKAIKERLVARESVYDLASEYRVCSQAIRYILNGDTWPDVPWPEGHGPNQRGKRSKLTTDQVKIIKQQITKGDRSMSEIAKEHSVGPNVVYGIKANACWRHVPWPEGHERD